MYSNKFVLSIIYNEHPVKETGYRGSKEVAVPFNSEYKIRLKNKNDRSCTARIFIDDKKVSQLGDIIVNAGGTVDLERYIDRSLEEGKKFKFVSLDHSDVDDPTSSENGIIKVEFRKAKFREGIKVFPPEPWPYPPVYPPSLPPFKTHGDGNTWGGADWIYTSTKTTGDASDIMYVNHSIADGSVGCYDSSTVEAGATVEGGHSSQSFSYSDIKVEDNAVILQLKIVGIKKGREVRDKSKKYCTQCGSKARQVDKYCSGCGQRL